MTIFFIFPVRLAPTWQYFGTITGNGLHGIISCTLRNPKSEFSAPLQNYLPVGH